MSKGNREKSKKTGKLFPGVIIIAFIASAITFFLLLHIEKSILSDYEKELVWVAAVDLQSSLEIEKGHLGNYFEQVEIDKKRVPEQALKEVESLEGCLTAMMIPKGTILSAPMFTDVEAVIESMTKPAIAGCKAEDLFQVASGILRKGDRVNIYTVNEELGEAYLLWEDVLVYQTFDSAGNLILPENTNTAAARINLLLEEVNVEQFYSEMYKGSLRMVKLWDL